jgi:hypothetical protein
MFSAEKLELSESAGPEGSFEDDILLCFEMTIMPLLWVCVVTLKTLKTSLLSNKDFIFQRARR